MDSEMMLGNEAGASDNRMSLSPGDNPAIKDWQDGQTYKMTVMARQVSPGEFQIVGPVQGEPTEPGQENETPAEDAAEPGEEGGEPAPGGYSNPAVEKLMRGPKA